MDRQGRIEVIAGPMFAGKSEELLRRVRRAAIARRSVQVFTHSLDERRGPGTVSSHSGLQFPSNPASSAGDIEKSISPNTILIAVDEAQFFGRDLLGAALRMADTGLVVILAGLDVTFSGTPFPPVPELMALAERVDKLTAICSVCGSDAVYHQRRRPPEHLASNVIPEHIGGMEKYEARCRRHFEPVVS